MARIDNIECPKCGKEAFSGYVGVDWEGGSATSNGECSACGYTGSLEDPTPPPVPAKRDLTGCIVFVAVIMIFFLGGLGILWLGMLIDNA